ncbi:MAG: AAA family ATPase [Chitinophagaceae bacterium]
MLPIIIIAIVVLRIIAEIIPEVFQWTQKLWQQIKQKTIPGRHTGIFDNSYVEVKAFYLREFKQVPCISYIGRLDVTKVFNYIQQGNCGNITGIYQYNWFNWQEKRLEFSKTIFKLGNRSMIKLGEDNAEILFDKNNYDFANRLIENFKIFEAPVKEQDYEINIITLTSSGLELKQLPIKPTLLDIDLYYNDDFKAVDTIIRERLAKENDKGIILLHGLPGTGKTTYLRHLIGHTKKKVLFVSPAVAGNLMNPEFIDLLIDNPNAVLVIEDAENIIMDRKYNSDSSVSNLLNISDGLLSDCLNVQIICTFNSALNMIDSALLRKGRLIAKYEFGKLDVTKAVKLAAHLGVKQRIDKAMTLADITNPDETHYEKPETQTIGFRRQVIEN